MSKFYTPVRLDEWIKNHDENWAEVTLMSESGHIVVSMFECQCDYGYYWTAAHLTHEFEDLGFYIFNIDGGLWGPSNEADIDKFLKNPESDEFVHTVSQCLRESVLSLYPNTWDGDTDNLVSAFYVISENSVIFEDTDAYIFCKLFDIKPSSMLKRIHKIRKYIKNDSKKAS